MTQVQTIGGLKQRRGRGRGRGTGRGRGGRSGRNDKPQPFEPFKGPAKSLCANSSQQQPTINHGSGVFATEQQHLAGVAKLQQQHDEAIALRAVQMAELQKQQQAQQAQASCPSRSEAPTTSAPSQPPAISSAESDIIDLCDDMRRPPHQALRAPARPPARPPPKPQEQISWSLGVGHTTSNSSVPSGSSNSDNPFWAPARYMPVGGETQADLRLQTQEVVQVLDSGLVRHKGTAILDTGNAGCTLITKSFARQLGLIDMHGNPTQAYSQTIRVQGVVAGAFELIKTLNITYEIKGKRMHIMAGLTEARLGCDLLISRREIADFESDGYMLSAR